MLAPFFVDRCIVCPILPTTKVVVVEPIAICASQIAYVGYVKLNIGYKKTRIVWILVGYG